MKQRILLALALVTVMAAPAFASVQNVKISGFINSSYVYRDRFDMRGRGTDAQEFEQKLFLTQTGLQVDADLSDNVSTTIGLINERAWGEEDQDSTGANVLDSQTDVDIYKAYVTLREMLYSPLTVVIGRQQFNYGNAFIVGAGGVNNATTTDSGLSTVANDLSLRTSYDGVKAILDYNPLTVDLIAAKLDANNLQGAAGLIEDDIDLYGANANYKLGDDLNTVVEGYMFARIDNSTENTIAGAKSDTVYVPGLRASTNPLKGLSLSGEVAWQRGNKVVTSGTTNNQKREAMGAQAIAVYALPFEETAKWSPVVSTAYTYTSGDQDTSLVNNTFSQASAEVWTAWDPMLEGQNGGKIYNSIFSLTNSHIVELAATVKPMEDVTTKLTWTGLWLDKDLFQTGTPLGAGANVATCTGCFTLPDGTAFSPNVTSNTRLGSEIDADINYAYTEDVNIGLSLGWYMPGDAFDSTHNENAKQAIAKVGVLF